MRRNLAPVLIGLGAFLLVAGVLVRFYAYPRLAVAPVDIDSTTRLEAKGATIFNSDPKVLAEMETDLNVVSVTRGNVGATEEAEDGTLVWAQTTRVTSADGVDRSLSTEQAAHDEVTGAAVDAAEDVNWVETPFDTTPGEEPEIRRVPVERTGQIFKFPFGTEKKTYQYWDGDIEQAPDATFEGEEEIDGLTVYKFVQSIPATKIGTRDVPASVFGLKGDAVEADSVYAVERTMWVEPQTGAIIDRSEKQLSTVEYDGHEIRATDATFQYTDEQVTSNVDKASSKAMLLSLASGAGWIALAVLGLLVIVGGVLAHLRRRA
jgi:hypothetical protein